ncbi:TetR/AcrR family transcriptional regulator [Salana multivorans]
MDDDGLLPAVRAAHGLDRASRPPARPGLTLERIVDAAVAIADGEGLAAVSMAKVASRLGFTTMSLYRHVSSKDELVMHMEDAVQPVPPADLATTQDWREGLRRWTQAQIAGVVAHPWVLEIPITGPPLMPNALAWMEVAMKLMADLPLRGLEKLAVLTILGSHVRIEATIAVTVRAAYDQQGISAEDEGPVYEQALMRLTEDGRFPLLREMAASGELMAVPADVEDPDAYYASFPIELLLDGVATQVERRRGAKG